MFGDMAIVVVRKDGSAEVLKKRKLNYDSLYKSRPFDLSGANRPLLYLTPNGVAEPVGRSR
jgi:hypothetical protein